MALYTLRTCLYPLRRGAGWLRGGGAVVEGVRAQLFFERMKTES